MMKTLLPALLVLFAAHLPALAQDAAVDSPKSVALIRAWPNLEFKKPISLIQVPGRSEQLLVLQNGQILILPEDESAETAEVFLDISDRPLIIKDFEEGLLNLTFHPKFGENGRFFIYYTMQDAKRSVIAEMKITEDADGKLRADLETERVLLEVRQPFWNHNSGNMIFGPDDGYLYIALGDGGLRNDPLQTAQNLWVLNGKILRIDVDREAGSLPYGIPADNPAVKQKGVDTENNPFAAMEGGRGEIWAYGLRNPWGICFDDEGRFWCADVGQDLYEEINIIEKGGNYGWSFREGNHEFALNPRKPVGDEKFIDPIFEYMHTEGLSITGGYVYNGDLFPDLKGKYIYGDFNFGTIWALDYDFEKNETKSNEVIWSRDPKDKKGMRPTGFFPTPDGEVYVLGWHGQIFRMDQLK